MPVAEEVLGFTNEWYELAIATAVEQTLQSGTVIRAAHPTAIVATKFAAWHGRGGGDALASLDLHDVMALIDGRPELANELADADPRLGRSSYPSWPLCATSHSLTICCSPRPRRMVRLPRTGPSCSASASMH
jgi:hypothetical protein